MKSKLKYEGTLLPTNGSTVTLWEQTNASPLELESYILTLFHDQNGTIIGQFTQAADSVPAASATWRQFFSQATTPGGTGAATRVEVRVTEFGRWRFIFTVGGTTETIFEVEQATSHART